MADRLAVQTNTSQTSKPAESSWTKTLAQITLLGNFKEVL